MVETDVTGWVWVNLQHAELVTEKGYLKVSPELEERQRTVVVDEENFTVFGGGDTRTVFTSTQPLHEAWWYNI
jgi:hypothetical protein